MFDSEKYYPSCTVNFETIRGDFQYVKKKTKKQRHLTDFHSVLIYLCFALFSQLGLTVKGTCVVVFAQRHLTIS